MSEYMKHLKDSIRYTSLKEQYNKMTAILFNKIEDNNACTTLEDMDKSYIQILFQTWQNKRNLTYL